MTTIGPSLYCEHHRLYYPINGQCEACEYVDSILLDTLEEFRNHTDPLIQGEATPQDHYNEYRPDKRDLRRENERMLTALESINRIVTDMLDPERRRGP